MVPGLLFLGIAGIAGNPCNGCLSVGDKGVTLRRQNDDSLRVYDPLLGTHAPQDKEPCPPARSCTHLPLPRGEQA